MSLFGGTDHRLKMKGDFADMIFAGDGKADASNQHGNQDDELMDDLVSMDWSGDNKIAIITCKKEITLELTGQPFSEKIV